MAENLNTRRTHTNPFSIESLLKEGHLADAHTRFIEFLRACEEEMSLLIQNQGRLSQLENEQNAGTVSDNFERNRIALNFLTQVDKFRRGVLNKYFDINTREEFFDSITDRDAVIHQILDYRLQPKNYLRERQLMEGNSAIVYQLSNPVLGRHAIALVFKIPTLRETARADILRLTDLRHRNVIKLIDHDLLAFPYFVITEYVYGSELLKAIEVSGPRPVAQAVDWLYQLTDALDYLRHKRIFHTNIRPSKIYVDDEWQIMISPFDLGQFSNAEQTHNRYRDVCQYGSPELFEKDGSGLNLSEMCISDQYSLGLLAYKILTGNDLFAGENIYAILESRRLFSVDKKVRENRFSQLPDVHFIGINGKKLSLNGIIRRLLEEDPAKRYPNLHAVLRVLHPLSRADQQEASIARKSYRRCLGANKEFINDFYRSFIKKEKAKGNTPATFADDFSNIGLKRQSAMLQMAIDVLIDSENNDERLTKIMRNDKHKNYAFPDFELFVEALLQQIKTDDLLWNDEVAAEWKRIKVRTLSVLADAPKIV